MSAAQVTGLRLDVSAGRNETQNIIEIERLALQSGKLTVLSGPSGSGKSTLLYLLSGLLVPSAGAVVWDGLDLAGESESARDKWRRLNAGFIFQNFQLVDELGPVENVLMPAWFDHVSAKPWRDRAKLLLEKLGVPLNRKTVSLLSRGEQQRVAVARALLFDPKVVFADEPTASLDGCTGRQVADILKDLARNDGKTIIVASHDPVLLGMADEIIRIDRGCIIGADQIQADAA
ncbi:ATP-binding cassette domain-containing protein [Mesorhizobium sp. SB112]|uniref:ABC transporter ATP-binding protein n=1 Tax=Mesorhizobium sp. SB112 TaxID=3151853 RepID=UPI0032630F65